MAVVIQAERVDAGTALGVRPVTGGNGICTVEEVEFVDDFTRENKDTESQQSDTPNHRSPSAPVVGGR